MGSAMNYAWFDIGDGRQVYRRIPEPVTTRSDLPVPYIATDTMDAVQSQASGKMYDSKSAIRAEYKALGYVEVGNDPARLRAAPKPKPDRKAIRQALEKARAKLS